MINKMYIFYTRKQKNNRETFFSLKNERWNNKCFEQNQTYMKKKSYGQFQCFNFKYKFGLSLIRFIQDRPPVCKRLG
jgi:hypothetical protein